MIKVSVVVPVYNVAKYLRRCLDSLVRQTLREIEIICVDDGSTDGSGVLLDEYAAKDARIRVVHQPNAGAGPARNAGLDVARGDYLFVCDPDDWCDRRMLREMFCQARCQDVDVLVVSNFFCDGLTGRLRSRRTMPRHVNGRDWPMAPTDAAGVLFQLFSHVPWNRLLKTSFVREKGLRFQALPRFNDAYFVKVALASAGRIGVLDRAFYNHLVRRPDSAQQACDRHPLCGFLASDAVRACLISQGVFDHFRQSWAFDLFRGALADLKAIHSPDAFCTVFKELHRRIVEDGDMSDASCHSFCVGTVRDSFEKIAGDESPVSFLLSENVRLRRIVLSRGAWKRRLLDLLPRCVAERLFLSRRKGGDVCESR